MDKLRRKQVREYVKRYRQKLRSQGVYQYSLYLKEEQAKAIREWLRDGGDISVFQKRVEK
ncbi:hypothetical protein HF288_07765 [Acidithiobacillus caldus]|uniref:hypothetical protein n=1 Tax=Acidithiobacillus caldus TaxID=33059 RepID=UPI001C070547|nr:hypothetical protein [Acidithiobacillus caldus]MBU2791387.1 hypothetical protein [Acidithiobacillus caldus]MBU2821215.1 hypothetical protein [Acidithiobacillus caldus]